MKRSALLFAGLALGAAGAAEAQLTMQMGNGWTFGMSGNVNAFLTYEAFNDDGTTGGPGVIVPAGGAQDETRIRTGLLPAFAVFDAKGVEGNTTLGVHFGFAPQINLGAGVHDNFGNGTQAGAQIDMRQVYLTVGGSWGQILAGREIGLFGRQNILTDQTLFGIGATGSSGVPGTGAPGNGTGTTLGRIGFGYIYPNFVAQMTYSTPMDRPFQLSVGLFEAASNGDYSDIKLPRVEAEGVWSGSNTKLWVGGMVQNNENPTNEEKATAYGVSGGLRVGSTQIALTGSGYYGQGIGTTLLFNEGTCGGCGTAGADDLRKSYGFIGQLTFTPANSKMTFAGSYGSSYLKASDTEGGSGRTENTLISGGVYYQATKSLKAVGELNYALSKTNVGGEKNSSFTPAVGLMLFY